MSTSFSQFNVFWFNNSGETLYYVNTSGQTVSLADQASSGTVKTVQTDGGFTTLPGIGNSAKALINFEVEVIYNTAGNNYSVNAQEVGGANPTQNTGPAVLGNLKLSVEYSSSGGLIVGAIDILVDEDVKA